MYKVIIIDDNLIIRKSILARVNWNEIDMEVIGEASNGKEAFDLICHQEVDIVITDIKMPKIDGLTLIEKTKDAFPHIQYIIISSFNDFKYTKKAILFKVVNYLLKPINNNELLNALETCKRNIIEIQQQRKQEKNMLYRKEFISFSTFNNEMISYLNNPKNKNIDSILSYLNFNKSHDRLMLLSINTVNHRLDNNFVYEISKQLNVHHDTNINTFRLNENIFIILAKANDLDSLLLNKLVLQAKTYLNDSGVTNPYFSCSSTEKSIDQFKDCYNECIDALYYRFLPIPSLEGVYHYKRIDSENLSDDELNNYRLALNLGVKDQALETLQKIFNYIKTDCLTSSILKFTLRSILNIINNTLLSNNLNKKILGEEVFNRYYFLKYNELAEIHNFFIHLTETICDNIKSNTVDAHDKIITYIKTNYNKSITLNSIAENFYMNTNYLGQLIKKHTGQTFNQFINSLRIEQAKQILIKQPDIKLNDLAHSIGYADSQYFSKVFRKITGFTPTQYKNK